MLVAKAKAVSSLGKFIVTLGLYADLQAAVAVFLRKFDVSWHDPALSIREKKQFIQRRLGL